MVVELLAEDVVGSVVVLRERCWMSSSGISSSRRVWGFISVVLVLVLGELGGKSASWGLCGDEEGGV